MIEEDSDFGMEEEQGCCSCSDCSRPIEYMRGFGIFEGGPTLGEDEERDRQDRVVGMDSPMLITNHEDLDKRDDTLNPRPYQTEFTDLLRIEGNKMAVGQALGLDGSGKLGSFMSPDSIRRILFNLPPKDIFDHSSRPLVIRLRLHPPKDSKIELRTEVIPQKQGVPA